MDRIHIDSLTVDGTHGHYEQEWSREQRFDVSLSVGVDARASSKSDALSDTIDYDDLKRIVFEVFKGARHYLIEALAEEIATRILLDERALEATITIRKLEVWDNGVPGVTITRARVSV